MRITNEISLDCTKAWLLRAKKASETHSTIKQIFITATQQIIESFSPASIPETFQLDAHKFDQSHQHIDDLTLISLLLLLARQTLAGFSAGAATPKNIPQYTNNEIQQLKAQLYVILNDGKLPSPQVKQVVLSDNNGKLLHYNVVDLVSASVNNNSGNGLLKHKHSHSITMALVQISHSVQHKLGIDDSGPSEALLGRLREWHEYHYGGKSSVYHLLKRRLYDNLKQHLLVNVGSAQNTLSPHPSLNDPCSVDVASLGRKMSNIVDFNYRVYEGLYARILYTPQVDTTVDECGSHPAQQHHTSHKHITKSQSHQSQDDRAGQKQAIQLSQNHTIPT